MDRLLKVGELKDNVGEDNIVFVSAVADAVGSEHVKLQR